MVLLYSTCGTAAKRYIAAAIRTESDHDKRHKSPNHGNEKKRMGFSICKKEAKEKKSQNSTPGRFEPLLYRSRSEHSTGWLTLFRSDYMPPGDRLSKIHGNRAAAASEAAAAAAGRRQQTTCVYKPDFSIVQTWDDTSIIIVYIFTLERKKGIFTHTHKNIRDSNHGPRGQKNIILPATLLYFLYT